MHLEIRSFPLPLPDGQPGLSLAWTGDYLRHHLCFALAHHGDTAVRVRAELSQDDCDGRRGHHFVLAGATERFGPFCVEGRAPALHGAIDRALHRFELHLVERAIAPPPPARESARPPLAA